MHVKQLDESRSHTMPVSVYRRGGSQHLDGFMVGITMVRAGRAIAAPSDRSVREYTPDTDRNVSQLFFALRTSNEI